MAGYCLVRHTTHWLQCGAVPTLAEDLPSDGHVPKTDGPGVAAELCPQASICRYTRLYEGN